MTGKKSGPPASIAVRLLNQQTGDDYLHCHRVLIGVSVTCFDAG